MNCCVQLVTQIKKNREQMKSHLKMWFRQRKINSAIILLLKKYTNVLNMPLLAQYSLRFQIYFLVLWGTCQALNEFIPKNHIFVCFYSNVSSENINRFQTPLIPWKMAQGNAITKALKEAKLPSSLPKPLLRVYLRRAAVPTGMPLYTWEGSTHHSSTIPKLPLGDL